MYIFKIIASGILMDEKKILPSKFMVKGLGVGSWLRAWA